MSPAGIYRGALDLPLPSCSSSFAPSERQAQQEWWKEGCKGRFLFRQGQYHGNFVLKYLGDGTVGVISFCLIRVSGLEFLGDALVLYRHRKSLLSRSHRGCYKNILYFWLFTNIEINICVMLESYVVLI